MMKLRTKLQTGITVALLSFGLTALAHAESQQDKLRHVRAMQFGEFFGGYASQYDECAKRGLVPRPHPSAETVATGYLNRMYLQRHDKDDLVYVMKGWKVLKQRLKQQQASYWKSNCGRIRLQWDRYASMLKLPK